MISLRSLAKSPGFTITALLTLALGIGLNTTMFSGLNAILFRSPYPDDGRLVRVYRTSPYSREWPHSVPNFLEHQKSASSFEALSAVDWTSFNLAEPGQPAERLRGLQVSGNFFQLLGVSPELGRSFTAEDDQPGHNQVLVISHTTWQQRFGGQRDVLGRQLRINGEPVTIVGVMPANFDYPQIWGQIAAWRPIAFSDDQRKARGSNFLTEIGRLKPGVSLGQAQAEMSALAARLALAFPDVDAGEGLRLVPLPRSSQSDTTRELTWFVMGLSGFVLLIACVNLANLQFARHAARAREHAIRAALGATRFRLMRSILAESLLLALAGGGLGVLLAIWGNDLVGARFNLGGSGLVVPLDWRVISFAFGVSALTGIGFGLMPAWLAARADVNDVLKQGGRNSTAGRSQHRLRQALIVAEVALALVLLAGAAFFVRGLQRFTHRESGWQPDGLVTASLNLRGSKYADEAARRTFVERLRGSMNTLPGVATSAYGDALPTFGFASSRGFRVEGRPAAMPGATPLTINADVSPGYFQTLGLRLSAGRDFTADDTKDKPAVVIVNETLARTFWPGESPLGKRLGSEDDKDPNWRVVIGVVADAQAPGSVNPPNSRFQIYVPYLQEPVTYLQVALRTNAAPDTITPALRRIVADIDPDQPVYSVNTVRHDIDAGFTNLRLAGGLLTGFALLGAALAAIGIYGVISGSVVQRTNELGIRLALGAQLRDILTLILGQGLRLAALGLVLGLAGAYGVACLLRAIAAELPPPDLLTLAVVTAFLFATAAFACWLPARRATKVNPITALRAE